MTMFQVIIIFNNRNTSPLSVYIVKTHILVQGPSPTDIEPQPEAVCVSDVQGQCLSHSKSWGKKYLEKQIYTRIEN